MKSRHFKSIIIPLIILGLILLSWWQLTNYLSGQVPDGIITTNGRIEGTEVMISPKIAGRIETLLKTKGDLVQRGELLVNISSEQVAAKVKQSEAGVSVAEAAIREAGENVRYWESKMDETVTAIEYTKKETSTRIAQAEAVFAAVKASLTEAEVSLEELQNDYRRYKALHEDQLLPAQILDKAKTAFLAGEARLEAARKKQKEAQASLELARLGNLAV